MKKKSLVALLVCTMTLASTPVAVFADSYDDQIEAKDKQINKLKTEQADAQAQIDALTADIETVNKKVKELEAKEETLTNETLELQDTIAKLKVRIAKRQEKINAQARDTQVNGQASTFIDAVLGSDSVSEAISRVQAMSTLVGANQDLLKQQQEDEKAVEEKVQENEAKIKELAANQEELANQKEAIANQQAELKVMKASLATEQAKTENDKKDLQAKKAAAEAEAARIKKEQEAAEKARQEAAAKQAAAAKKAQEEAAKQEAAAKEKQTTNTSSSSSDSKADVEESVTTPSNDGSNNGGSSSTEPSTPATPSEPEEEIETPSTGTGGTDHSNSGNMYAYGQCTWYVKSVAPWVGTYWGNGAQWGASAAADGYRVDGSPEAGSVVVFGAGQMVGDWQASGAYGHVAYVQSYNASSNTITITQGGMGFSNPGGPNTQTLSASGFQYIHRY